MKKTHLLLALLALGSPFISSCSNDKEESSSTTQQQPQLSPQEAVAELEKRHITPARYNRCLIYAAANNDMELLNLLIIAGADINKQNEHGQTAIEQALNNSAYECISRLLREENLNTDHCLSPVEKAAITGDNEALKQLIANGANINTVNNTDNRTPVLLAARYGHTACLQSLLNAGAIIGKGDSNNNTPLHLAAENGHLDCVKLLQNAGANINQCNLSGLTPLHLAAEHKHHDTVQHFLSTPGISSGLLSSFTKAIIAEDAEKLEDELKTPIGLDDTDTTGRTPLHWAAIVGNPEFVRQILSAKPMYIDTQDKAGCTPLHYAIASNNTECVRLLLSVGANVNRPDKQKGLTPLHWACIHHHDSCIPLLIGNNAQVNEQNNASKATPLYIAASHGHSLSVQKLLQAGANACIADQNGNYPIYAAARNGHYDCMALLEQATANEPGVSLIAAIYTGEIATVQGLIAQGVGVNQADINGITPLYAALVNDLPEIATILLNAPDIIVNQPQRNGKMPLAIVKSKKYDDLAKIISSRLSAQELAIFQLEEQHGILPQNFGTSIIKAAVSGNTELIQLLLTAGTDVNYTNNGKTALSTACENGQVECARQLLAIPGIDKELGLPLHAAAASGQAPCVTLLAEAGLNINATDELGRTPLYRAAEQGRGAVIQALLKLPGIDTKQAADNGYTPHDIALNRNHEHCIKYFYELLTPQEKAVYNLRQEGIDKNAYESELIRSAANGDTEQLERLITAGVNINTTANENGTALTIAAYEGHADYVEQLLNTPGIDVNSISPTHPHSPLTAALYKKHYDIAKLLLDVKGIDVNLCGTSGEFPLMQAINHQQYQLAEQIIQTPGINVNQRCKDTGYTALHTIITRFKKSKAQEQTTLIALLLKAGANPSIRVESKDKSREKFTNAISQAEASRNTRHLVPILKKAAKAHPDNQNGNNYADPESCIGLGCTVGVGSTLEGTFYDLKKDKNGRTTGITPGNQKQVVEALHEYFASWQENKLDKYYQAQTRLYASCWYLPNALANYAPIAFGVGDPKEKDVMKWKCQPSAWLAVYRGQVKAPKSGYFRFIGTGDDFFAVRFNKKLALSAGYRIATDYDKKNSDDCFIYHGDANVRAERLKKFLAKHKGFEMITGVPGCQIWDGELSGLVAGTPFMVKEGETYPIEIAIAEIPGGIFGFILFIEEVNSKGEPIDKSKKKYDLFRTCNSNPDPDQLWQKLDEINCLRGRNSIDFNEESLVWEFPIVDEEPVQESTLEEDLEAMLKGELPK